MSGDRKTENSNDSGDLHRCLGRTANGSRCKRRVKDREYCSSHIDQKKESQTIQKEGKEKPELISNIGEDEKQSENGPECCICLESDKTLYELESCGHGMHMDCLLQLRKLECPLCRTSIQDSSVTKQWKPKEGPDYEEIPLEDNIRMEVMVPVPFVEMLLIAEHFHSLGLI